MAAQVETILPKPIALCLERLEEGGDERYVRCTARTGREAGLALGLDGSILWCRPEPTACDLWVSLDQRLMAFRPEGAPQVVLVRAKRVLELPCARAVVLRNGDELILGARRFRVHVHGTTDEVHPPRPLRDLPRAAALAVAVALGAAVPACASSATSSHGDRVDARPTSSTIIGAIEPAPVRDAGDFQLGAGQDAGPLDAVGDGSDDSDAIEVRPFPPK